MTTKPLPTFLTRAEVANLLRVGVQTVDRFTRDGKLPTPIRVGKKFLFLAQDVYRQIGHQEEPNQASDSA